METAAPEVGGIARQNREDRTHKAQHACQIRSGVRILDRGPERNIAQIEQKQYQKRRQSCIPDPVCAPNGLAPYSAGQYRQKRHGYTDRSRGLGGQCADVMPPDQPHK